MPLMLIGLSLWGGFTEYVAAQLGRLSAASTLAADVSAATAVGVLPALPVKQAISTSRLQACAPTSSYELPRASMSSHELL